MVMIALIYTIDSDQRLLAALEIMRSYWNFNLDKNSE